MKTQVLGILLALLCCSAMGQEGNATTTLNVQDIENDDFIIKTLDEKTAQFSKVAREIWENP
ncbi:MAG: hypothetical protein ACFB0A_14510, partial [Croceivirga sp.]